MASQRRLEVRIPISPRDDFFNRVHLIALSIRSLKGHYADAKIRVTISSEKPWENLYEKLPWSRTLDIEWYWLNENEFSIWKNTENPYTATIMERFSPPFDAKNILMLDADIMVLRSFDELISHIENHGGIAGVMAYLSPFLTGPGEGHINLWNVLFEQSNLPPPDFNLPLSGWGILDNHPARKMSPPYFNTGMMLAKKESLELLYPHYVKSLEMVRTSMNNYCFEQIALTLAIFTSGIPYHILPVRYNFQNRPEIDRAYPDEMEKIKFLHFLHTSIIKRDVDFQNIESIMKFTLRKDLIGSNEMLRQYVANVFPKMINHMLEPIYRCV